MQDLIQGSIPKHVVRMAMPIAMDVFVQTILVELCCFRDHLHLLRHVPGTREYCPGDVEQRHALAHLRRAGLWLASRPDFSLRHLWFLSVATVSIQAGTSLWLLRRQFRQRLVVATTASRE